MRTQVALTGAVSLVLAGCGSLPSEPRANSASESPLVADVRAGGASTPADATARFVRGSLAMRYRARRGSGDRDQDLYGVLSLALGDERRTGWNAELLLEGAFDLDGRSSRGSPFYSLADTEDGSFTSRVYEAYVENQEVKALDVLRLGRQIDYETPAILTYDGLKAVTREFGPGGVRMGAYGGVPAHVYTAARAGDKLFGAFVEARPWSGARARVDWLHVEDRELYGETENDLTAIALRQRLDEHADVEGSVSWIDGRGRDIALRGTYADTASDLVVRGSVYHLLETQNELALELDPFTSVLLEQVPYTDVRVSVSKGLGERLRVDAGADVRRVSDADEIGAFNRDFDRAYATTTLDDVLATQVALSLTGELWRSGSDAISTWGVDLTRMFGAAIRASAGSYYSLYKYDLFQLDERDDVRTYYVGLRFKRDGATSFDVRYEHEDSFDDYDTLRLGATWHF